MVGHLGVVVPLASFAESLDGVQESDVGGNVLTPRLYIIRLKVLPGKHLLEQLSRLGVRGVRQKS